MTEEYKPKRKEIFKQMAKNSGEFGKGLLRGALLTPLMSYCFPYTREYYRWLISYESDTRPERIGKRIGAIPGTTGLVGLCYLAGNLIKEDISTLIPLVAPNVLFLGHKMYNAAKDDLIKTNKES